MVFPMKNPKRKTAKAIIQVDLSTLANKSNLTFSGGGGGEGGIGGCIGYSI
jgi:hypothetical protein